MRLGDCPDNFQLRRTRPRARQLAQSISDFVRQFFLLCFPVRLSVNHPEFQQVCQFHRFLFVTGAAGLEKSFTDFFSQLFDLFAKLQPSFMLQPLEIRVVEERRFHRKTAA
jgi:hypothetical protein